MNKFALAALAAAAAVAAFPAAAQTTTGTVNITGTVAGRCSVINSGVAQQSFTGSIDLGRLDADDGTLRSALVSSLSASPADAKTVSARVVCTSANPTIGVQASKLSNGNAAAAADGYSNVIDYTASLKVKTAASTTVEAQYKTLSDSAAVTKKLGGRIAGGSASNVEVSIFGLAPTNGTTSVLEQGTYNSTVSVTIEPTV
jgi:hypothetical protein